MMNGKVAPVGGTSASTPAFAGLVSLINDARLSAGGKAMGFLNPWIYKNQDCFTGRGQGQQRYRARDLQPSIRVQHYQGLGSCQWGGYSTL